MRCTPQTRNNHWPTTLLKTMLSHLPAVQDGFGWVALPIRFLPRSRRTEVYPGTDEPGDSQYGGGRIEVSGHSIPPTVAWLSYGVPLPQISERLRLIKSFYILGNRLGLLFRDPRNALIVRRFHLRITLGDVIGQLAR